MPSDNVALLATFAKDAVVMLPRVAAKIEPDLEHGEQIAGMNPHAEMNAAKLGEVVAGGNASMAWIAAELEINHPVIGARREAVDRDAHGAGRRTTRCGVGMEGRGGVAHRGAVARTAPPVPRGNPVADGSRVVKLLAAPDELSKALSGDRVVVFGTDKAERAIGQPAAKALLAKWRKLPLAIEEADKVREVRTASWGFAVADVNIAKGSGPPHRMSAFVIAVPGPSGAWSVVAVNYGAL